jgi:phospholipase C
VTDQTSILKFVEDNWGLGRIGDSSYDAIAGSLDGMFAMHGRPATQPVILDEKTGAVKH